MQIYKYTHTHTLRFSSAICDHWLRHSVSPVQVETAEGCCPRQCSAAAWAVGNTQVWKSLYYRRSPDEPTADLPALSTQKCIHYTQPHQHLCCDLFIHLSFLYTQKNTHTHTIWIRDWLLTVPTWLANVFMWEGALTCMCLCTSREFEQVIPPDI